MAGPARERTGDRIRSGAVHALWAGMLLWALLFVHAYAPPFPIGDDSTLYDVLLPQGGFAWARLWRLHNEHLIPLPRLLFVLPYALTGDLRAAEYLQVLMLGGVALLSIRAARAVRGGTSFSDALFPILWLHVGNATNLLSGFQISLSLPTAVVGAFVAGIAISSDAPGLSRSIWMSLGLVSLPLSGGVGLAQAPALGAWTAWSGWKEVRNPDRRERAAAWIRIGATAICAILCLLYVRQLAGRPAPAATHGTLLSRVVALLALGLGPGDRGAWAVAGGVVGILLVATLALLLIGVRADDRERGRRLGVLSLFAGGGCLVASIAFGRAAKDWDEGYFVLRYVMLTTPLICAAYFAWILYGGTTGRRIACAAIAGIAVLVCPWNARNGMSAGRDLRAAVERTERQVAAGASARELVESFTSEFPNHLPEVSRRTLQTLAALGRPPFDREPHPTAEAFDWLTFSRQPSRIESDRPTYWRVADGGEALVAHAGTAIHIDVRAGEKRVSGRFGVPAEMVEEWKAGPVRVIVERIDPAASPRVLLDRTIDPSGVEADRGSHAFALEEGIEGPCEIVMRTESARPEGSARCWSYWADVRVE